MRDLQQVADKLKVVLMPLGKESQMNVIQKLRECKTYFFLCIFNTLIPPFRGSMGPSSRLSTPIFNTKYHCSWRLGYSSICSSICDSLGRCRDCHIECTTSWRYNLFLPISMYPRLLCLPSDYICLWLPTHGRHLQGHCVEMHRRRHRLHLEYARFGRVHDASYQRGTQSTGSVPCLLLLYFY